MVTRLASPFLILSLCASLALAVILFARSLT